jgi:ectoine hydroxylase
LYHKDGFFLVRGIFNQGDAEAIRRANQKSIENPSSNTKIIHEDGDPTQAVRSVMGHHQDHDVLDYFTRHPSLVELAETLLRSHVYVSQFKVNTKAPLRDGEAQGKKWVYHRGFMFWNTLDGIPRPDMFSLFIYLTEQTEQNGAVYALRGSHQGVDITQCRAETDYDEKGEGKREDDTAEYLSFQINPRRIQEYERQFERVVLDGKPGDVLVMHPLLLHASDKNLSQKSRDLMITVYNCVNNLPQHSREDYLSASNTRAISAKESI